MSIEKQCTYTVTVESEIDVSMFDEATQQAFVDVTNQTIDTNNLNRRTTPGMPVHGNMLNGYMSDKAATVIKECNRECIMGVTVSGAHYGPADTNVQLECGPFEFDNAEQAISKNNKCEVTHAKGREAYIKYLAKAARTITESRDKIDTYQARIDQLEENIRGTVE